ncbi:beta-1,6-N-acetylglucosaminyltransferase [Mucilaginibacter ginkgonis]|uniref:Peptide O-xylosyltransferase n=1 Tax=Mucilaginibacter ginkgonis TaxID=2682091 RepID=A0A6I4I092_9SPHI|nr:beta-1,6-N-acetylglucosaminyltransferase [Mucilaginibacter ginkgonis]QQL48880.1 glycosyl transferase [Mucilaginibacter ginkgonis]
MKLVHLILAHSAPAQLERLIRKLAHPDADIYIHLDKKATIDAFIYLEQIENVFFIKDRCRVDWGSFAMVQATLCSFKEILLSGKKYDYLNLLSGQDYPLKSYDTVHKFLKEHPNTAFMNFLMMETEWQEAMPRIEEYHFHHLKISGRFILQSVVNSLLPIRSFPGGMIPVGRSQWFTIPLDCVEYIVDFWAGNKKLQRFIKWTWAPDEFIFQTILFNSVHKSKMVNRDLRYIDWSAGGVSPKTLNITDADKMLASGAFWARKLDMSRDPALFDLLDEHAAETVA